MNIIAIDPGNEQSAAVAWDGERIAEAYLNPNREILDYLHSFTPATPEQLHIEMVACYGMPVGREVFETCLWIGRFVEAWKVRTKKDAGLTYRSAIKLHHCNSARAKDSNIRQALIDKYGAPGTKKQRGATYGLKGDLWQAFALATFATETKQEPA